MRLRKATLDDLDFLLKIKNDPVTRKYAVVTHARIKKKDHEKWLPKHLGEIRIAIQGNERIGMLRVSEDGEVSINLHPNWRGKGFGLKILAKCKKAVWAKIVLGNIPSMRLFLASGFRVVAFTDKCVILMRG